MLTQFQALLARHVPPLEAALDKHLPLSGLPGAQQLDQATRWAVFPGGHRMRPVLALCAGELVGCPADVALDVACALEFLHSASLVFDDLPCMDDDDQRRGRPSVHARFGQGTAVLAGLALLNQTYALLGRADVTGRLLREATRAIGHQGMIAGQALDLVDQTAGRFSTLGALQPKYLKTTAILALAVQSPALACRARESAVDALAEYGRALGMAYQLIDDVLDGDDVDVRAAGPRQALGEARRWLDRAQAAIVGEFGRVAAAQALLEFAESVWQRAGVHAEVHT